MRKNHHKKSEPGKAGRAVPARTPGQRILLFLIQLLVLTAAGLCLGVISLYFSAGLYSRDLLDYYLQQPRLVVLNTLPYVLLCYFFWFIFNRVWVGFTAGGLFALMYSFAEYWKLLARDDPVYAEDLGILSEALEMSERYIVVTPVMMLSVAAVLVGIVALFLVFRRARVLGWKLRIALPVVTLAICGALYSTTYTSEEVYNSFRVWEPLNIWFDNNKYISRGGIYPFIYSIQSAVPQEPEGYKEDEAQRLLEELENDDIPEEKKVSVIMVMLEAFADLSGETDMITGGDPYESYHRLQAESYCGKLVTNVFAGGTIDTERCVLTGFSALTSFRRDSWSYARYFAQQGYALNGSHAGYQAFYNRQNVNRNLGFDSYYFVENYYNQFTGNYSPMDWIFLPEVAKICTEQMAQGQPVFSFNVTYQNHGPYDAVLAEDKVEYVPRGLISDADHAIVNNYLSGVADTGNHLLAMADTFRDSQEPVVLVFFGDHKPWLGESSTTYGALNIDVLSENDESFYNHYETDYVIWANDAAKAVLGNEMVGQGPTVSPCFLMNVLFEQCGWEGPAYQKYTDEVMARVPVVTANGYYRENGGLVTEDALSDETRASIQRMQQLQYYLAMDSEGRMPE